MATQGIPGKPREGRQNLDLLKHHFSAMKKKKRYKLSKKCKYLNPYKYLQILKSHIILNISLVFLITKFCILLALSLRKN